MNKGHAILFGFIGAVALIVGAVMYNDYREAQKEKWDKIKADVQRADAEREARWEAADRRIRGE